MRIAVLLILFIIPLLNTGCINKSRAVIYSSTGDHISIDAKYAEGFFYKHKSDSYLLLKFVKKPPFYAMDSGYLIDIHFHCTGGTEANQCIGFYAGTNSLRRFPHGVIKIDNLHIEEKANGDIWVETNGEIIEGSPHNPPRTSFNVERHRMTKCDSSYCMIENALFFDYVIYDNYRNHWP